MVKKIDVNNTVLEKIVMKVNFVMASNYTKNGFI
jgi:hypothetical protein